MNKPSLLSSFLILAVTVFLILMIGWGVLKLVEKVSDDKNDFDYTSIHDKKETIGEISYQMETIDERMLKRIKSRRMNKRIYRYIDIKI